MRRPLKSGSAKRDNAGPDGKPTEKRKNAREKKRRKTHRMRRKREKPAFSFKSEGGSREKKITAASAVVRKRGGPLYLKEGQTVLGICWKKEEEKKKR